MHPRPTRESAQSMVEFALLAPLLFLLIIGTFDFGRAIYFYNAIAHGARQGARFAIALDSQAKDDIAIRGQAALGFFSMAVDSRTCAPSGDLCSIPPASSAISNLAYLAVSPPADQRQLYQSGSAVPGSTTLYPLTVTVTFYFQPATPLIAALVGNPIPLSVTTTMTTQY